MNLLTDLLMVFSAIANMLRFLVIS